MREQTPWGTADYCKELADGILKFSTPSHGRSKKKLPRHKVGEKVRLKGFTDCFGQVWESQENLIVVDVRKVETVNMPVYFRLTAHSDKGVFEAWENFFEPAL